MQKRASQPIEILKSAIDAFIHSDSNNEKLLDDFTKCFPINDIENMTLDDYCIGKGDKESFCYWIERRLKSLGYYSPGTSNSYLLYWNKDDKEYKVAGYLKKESETDPKSLMKILAGDISKFVKDKDNPEIYTDKFGESFILKVLNSYYRDDYFPVNSRRHINNIISLFDLKCNENISIFKKNKIINEFYKKQCDGKGISSFEFMHILYENFNIKDGEIKEENGEIIANGEYEMVQFHPSYDYTDFVEGLRPIGEEKDNNNVTFKRKDGVFKKLCVKAKINPNKNYVLVIDEINRGEISKIFGELFFSIDPGYRGTDGLVQTQYQNLVNDDDEFSEGFFVPKNVYIIGTMNDIDRSVESMDFAFRRRFAFVEVKANENTGMLEGKDWKEQAINRMNSLNAAIEKIEGLSSAYHIGASYFLKLDNYNGDFELLWKYHLEGLLFEYLRGMQNVEDKLDALHKAYQNDKTKVEQQSVNANEQTQDNGQ
ncbi:MAG: AAA family ATPase [Salinivirgaceae bacterium]|nr:AAA family ATPase [Salinivirgaceae bacterium]